MRVVFLDFDGVLNSGDWYYRRQHQNLHFDPAAVERLNRLVDLTDARIVVSSSWRIRGDVSYLTGVLEGYSFCSLRDDGSPRIVGATPRPGSFHIPEHLWPEGRFPYDRGHEIQAWLNENKDVCPVEAFVILDDGSDMAHLRPYLVHTNFQCGLTDDDVARAVEILTGPRS